MKKLIIISTSVLLTSCFKFVPLNSSPIAEAQSTETLVSRVEVGEWYIFGLRDGSTIKMQVNRMEKDSIGGLIYSFRAKRVSIPTKDITSIQKKKLAVGNTVIFAVALVAAVYAIFLASIVSFYP